jgi:hypothetical protein
MENYSTIFHETVKNVVHLPQAIKWPQFKSERAFAELQSAYGANSAASTLQPFVVPLTIL